MTIQQLAEIASRHLTRMADAMIAAVVAKALETGEPLDIPERRVEARPAYVSKVREERVDWERMVRTNSDTRHLHC